MTRLAPLALEDLSPELQEQMAYGLETMGFTANDGLTMARLPGLLPALGSLVRATYTEGTVPLDLKKLIALVTSSASGCVYCQTHTAHGAWREGVDPAKIDAVWEYETSDLFSDAERAALRVAQGGGLAPVGCTDEDFDVLRQFYNDDQIAEIVGVIATFGFLNKWNAVVATEIEDKPKSFTDEHLAGRIKAAE